MTISTTGFYKEATKFMLAIGLLAGLCMGPALAESPKSLGTFKDWSAYSLSENGQTVCFAVSEPQDKLPKTAKHGDVFFLISNWIGGSKGEPSLVTGYTFKAGSSVTAEIGSSKWNLFAKDNGAWIREAVDEKKLINAMKNGSTMRMKGTSARGTATEYQISLSGVTKAINAINTSCQ